MDIDELDLHILWEKIKKYKVYVVGLLSFIAGIAVCLAFKA